MRASKYWWSPATEKLSDCAQGSVGREEKYRRLILKEEGFSEFLGPQLFSSLKIGRRLPAMCSVAKVSNRNGSQVYGA